MQCKPDEGQLSDGGLIGDISSVIGNARLNLHVKGKKWKGEGKE